MSDKFEIGDEVECAKLSCLFPNGIVVDKRENSDKICLFFDSKVSSVWVCADDWRKTRKHFYMVGKAKHENSIKFGDAVGFKIADHKTKTGMVIQVDTTYKIMDSTGHTYVINEDEIVERTGMCYKNAYELLDFLKLIEKGKEK